MKTSGLPGIALILMTSILLPGTCITSYFMATAANHVEERLPYISNTGTYAPESGVFGILLTFYSVSALVSVFCRWRIVCNHYTGKRSTPFINNIGLLLGSIASLGCLMVACFQETTQLTVHLIGATMAFAMVCAYMWLQAVLTHKVSSVPGHMRWLAIVRVLVAVATTISFVGTGALATVAEHKKPGNFSTDPDLDVGNWQSWMSGYDVHIASTSFEWALAGFVSIYFLTFCSEFRFITIGMPSVTILPSSKN